MAQHKSMGSGKSVCWLFREIRHEIPHVPMLKVYEIAYFYPLIHYCLITMAGK